MRTRGTTLNDNLSVFQWLPSVGAGCRCLKCRGLPEETAPKTAPIPTARQVTHLCLKGRDKERLIHLQAFKSRTHFTRPCLIKKWQRRPAARTSMLGQSV